LTGGSEPPEASRRESGLKANRRSTPPWFKGGESSRPVSASKRRINPSADATASQRPSGLKVAWSG
jgi:hypothetical protein